MVVDGRGMFLLFSTLLECGFCSKIALVILQAGKPFSNQSSKIDEGAFPTDACGLRTK